MGCTPQCPSSLDKIYKSCIINPLLRYPAKLTSTHLNHYYIGGVIKCQKECLWKQRTHYGLENGSLGFLRLFTSSNEVCNTAYAL